MTRILVTGSRGFLAGALIPELRRSLPGARLSLLSRAPAPGRVACDLSDPDAARETVRRLRPDWIFHLAGKRGAGPEELWRAHAQATVHLLEAVRALPRAARVRTVVAGSCAEYGDPARGARGRLLQVVEDSPPRPVAAYGASKLCQTLAALSYRHEGLQVLVARIFNVLGPGLPEELSLGSFAAQIARIERGLQPPVLHVGDLDPRRDYVDVRDAARALIAVARRGKAGEIYNVCSGASRSVEELLRRMLALSKRPIRTATDPGRLRRLDVPEIAGSGRKLARASGWRPRVPLRSSLRDTLEWHRRHVR